MSRQLSMRLMRLNRRLKTVDYNEAKPWYFENINILDIPENKHLKDESIVIRKAYSIRYVAEHMPTVIYDDELVVGVPNQSSVEFGICLPRYLTEYEREYFQRLGLSELSLCGHHLPNWGRIIEKGVVGLKEEIEKTLQSEYNKTTPDISRIDELRAMILSLDALVLFSSRYSDALIRSAYRCSDMNRKKELWEMHEICKKVPLYPADTFQEAVQSFWITYTLLASNGEFLPLGRIDQYFIKQYRDDMCNGRLNEEKFVDILGSFLIKCNEKNVLNSSLLRTHMEYSTMTSGVSYMNTASIKAYCDREKEHYYHKDEPIDSEHNKFFGQEANNRMMTCVVGGVTDDGDDATNEISYKIIELVNWLDLLMPTVGARVHNGTPKEFKKLIAEVLSCGQGEPIIYNDEAILRNYGVLDIPESIARGYTSDGCWETVIPGYTNFRYGMVKTLLCLESILNRGKSIKTGKTIGKDFGSLSNYNTFEEFYNAFISQIYLDIENIWENNLLPNIGIPALVAPDPLLSTLCEGCIERGEDFYGKGAKYQMRCLLLTGYADTVDSLEVIRKLVFEEKSITLDELNSVLLDNWKGHDRLHAFVVNNVDKYGNASENVDKIGVRLIRDFSTKIKELRKKGKSIVLTGGIGTFHMYALWGNDIGASANGRYAYEPLAPNYSPVVGSDSNGPIAIILSSTKPDLSDMMSGTPVDLSINHNEFGGEHGLERLWDLIQGFLDKNGQILTITVNSRKELEEAKAFPDKYQNLRVRMGGLSAYFVQLSPEAQNKIIERFI